MAKRKKSRRRKKYVSKITPLARSQRLFNKKDTIRYVRDNKLPETTYSRKIEVRRKSISMSRRHESINQHSPEYRSDSRFNPRNSSVSSLGAFRKDSICRSRSDRRRVLFALSSIGKGKGVSKIRNHVRGISNVRC